MKNRRVYGQEGSDGGRVEGKEKRVEEKEEEKREKGKSGFGKSPFYFCLTVFFFSQSTLWASASEPAGSVPSAQSQKREVGTIALWPHARAC